MRLAPRNLKMPTPRSGSRPCTGWWATEGSGANPALAEEMRDSIELNAVCGLTRWRAKTILMLPDLKAEAFNGCPQVPRSRRGSETALTEIKLKKGEPVEKALRRLKKKIDREGVLKEVRNHRHYEKPSERRRRKMKMARFSAMLSARYADL